MRQIQSSHSPPGHPARVSISVCDGRSPGLRVNASLRLPGRSYRPVAWCRAAHRLQLRGQPRDLTAFPFMPWQSKATISRVIVQSCQEKSMADNTIPTCPQREFEPSYLSRAASLLRDKHRQSPSNGPDARVGPCSEHNVKSGFGDGFRGDFGSRVGLAVHIPHRQADMHCGNCAKWLGKCHPVAPFSWPRACPHIATIFVIRK